MVDIEVLRIYFDYKPDTGELFNKVNRGTTSRKGDLMGTLTTGGGVTKKQYLRTFVHGRHYYVHRIAWALMTGEWPEEIDHIDGNGLNNKWDNLRNVDHKTNGRNIKVFSNNTSGTSGVTYRKDHDKWRARIMVDGKMISLGNFKDKESAINARKEAEQTYWS